MSTSQSRIGTCRLRLLKYCCRIWEQAEQEPGQLRAIVPVVLYQGRRRWPWPTELSELYAPVEREWPWTPRFAHLLIDQSQAAGERLGGGPRGRIALLALMAAYRHGREQLQLALRVVRLLAAPGASSKNPLEMKPMTHPNIHSKQVAVKGGGGVRGRGVS